MIPANTEENNTQDKFTSGQNLSYWTASTETIIFDKLRENIQTDILVIGGGIAGLTTAYCLAKAGHKVIVIEDGFIGSGESGRKTAHITCALDDRYYHLEKLFGEEKARLAANSHMSAIQWIANTVAHEHIDCHFKRVNGYLFLHSSDSRESLDNEYESTKRMGLVTEMLESIPGISAEEGKRCIKFPEQGQFHIMMYLRGLAQAIIHYGGKIYTETRGHNISKIGAEANGCKIAANHIVVATNTPINDMVTMHTKQSAYRTYVIAALIPKGQLEYSLWWDTGNQDSKWITQPYHYVRLAEYNDQYDLLISGGEDHRTGQADEEAIPEEERYNKLVDWTTKRFPAIEHILHKWSGQVMEPVDSMAFIGKNPGDDNIYIITGDSGNGITHGTLGGMIISDMLRSIANPWVQLYSPSRITLNATSDYLHEMTNMAAQYIDWIAAGDIEAANVLKRGEGGIVASGLNKVAVYRDAEMKLHAFSAICPHLKCILQWNGEEKTFDCPCHGSRFTTDGVVINGPAISNLTKMKIKD
jgi:glycine/D-amino acid oxidase-like deaminating enzyme/nitrite reductase/ring-hydroxylating ferredoxin subunit